MGATNFARIAATVKRVRFAKLIDKKNSSRRCATRKKPRLSSSTMDPECAKLVLLGTMLHVQCFHPWLEGQSALESWLEWETKTATSVTRRNLREVFCH